MKIAYFDCFSGISGDMTLGALLDLGVDGKWLKDTLHAVPLAGFDLDISHVVRSGINAKNVHVRIEDTTSSRNYTDIKVLIENSPLSEFVKKLSLDTFEKIADAESHIHNCPREKVHFHEVGGIDAIVDIVGTALCIERLDIKKVVSSKIPLGKGFVKTRHGTLPLPAPATIAILKDKPVYGTQVSHELVTPTGAAIITTLADSFDTFPEMVVKKVGYGAGKRDLEQMPNLLRVITGEVAAPGGLTDFAIMVETCIDDMNPEIFGFLMERLFEDGALDVYLIPIFMKKNRPGTMIKVLCTAHCKEAIISRILSETTAIGVRYYDVQRSLLDREKIEVDTPFGLIQVKRIKDPAGSIRIVPEYEVCRKIALERKMPIKIVYDTIAKHVEDL